MSDEITLYLDPTRVNRPFVPKENERSLFQEEIARFWDIFEALEQEQSPALKDARKANGNSVSQKRSRAKAIEGWSSGSNIVGIFGKRGSGKSSLMLSFFERLSLDKDSIAGDSNASGKNYPVWLDPALFMNRRLADVFLAKMYGMFKDWFEDDCASSANRTEELQKKLHEAFQRVQRAFSGIRSADEKGFSLGDLLLTSEANTIQRNVFDLVELMLEAMNHKEGKLVLFLDDFDLQERDVLKHLDDWKHFLNLPNVVVVLSAAQEELEELLVEGRMKDRVELMRAGASNAMRSLSSGRPEIVITGMPWLQKRELYERAHAHLLKVVGPNRRTYLLPNKASSTTKVKFPDSAKDLEADAFLSLKTHRELDMQFYHAPERPTEKGKYGILLNTWRDSSMREQVISMTQLLGNSKFAILDSNFSRSEVRQLEYALPNRAKRLEFCSKVVRWITNDRNAKSGKSLRDFCEGELRMEFRSSWQAFLLVNYMWLLLGDEDEAGDRLLNFLEVELESDGQFWGGVRVEDLSRLRGADLKSVQGPIAGIRSTFAAELMASQFWRTDEKAPWKLQLNRPKLAVNPLNAIPRLLLGTDIVFWTKFLDGDEELKSMHERFSAWQLQEKESEAYRFLLESLANPIFFSSLIAQFSKGSHWRKSGISGFFGRLENELIDNVLKVFEMRWGKAEDANAVDYSDMKALFASHPLNTETPPCNLARLIQDALDYNDEAKIRSARLNEELNHWKRLIKYLYSRRDDFLPSAFKDVPNPSESGGSLKKRARAIQVYLSRELHKRPAGKVQANYGDLNDAMRLADEAKLVEAAELVYGVIDNYIQFSERTLKELEFQLQEAESK